MSNRCFGDEQTLRDLLVLQSFANERNHFAFPIGEGSDLRLFRINFAGAIKLLNNTPDHRTVDPYFTFMNFLDRSKKQVSSMLFENNSHGAAAYSQPVGIGVSHSCQDDDPRGGTRLA